jgi:membrane-bound lytic murein transglycosylase D
MVKRFLAFTLFSVLLTQYAKADTGDRTFNVHSSISDTSDRKDSLLNLSEVNDPKEGFKDLFIASANSADINLAQLNPLALSFVEDYIGKFSKTMTSMKDWGKPYFDMMDEVFTENGLPKELKYLAVIESQLKSNARSWAGAVGPWQFMAGTARNMGLKVSRKVDERRDFYKSTRAASKYLTSLFELYGDWLLVIAAYNGGPGKVNAAIKKSGSRDFWTLQAFLPTESRNHVKKFIATHYLMEGQGGITTSTKEEVGMLDDMGMVSINTVDSAGVKMQSISGRYNSGLIIAHVVMERTAFNKINPGFDKRIALDSKYDLRLPSDKMEIFLQKKNQILSESIQLLLNPDYTSATN